MRIKYNRRTGRLDIMARNRLILLSCGRLPRTYYIVPTMRFDNSREYCSKSLWFMLLSAFILIESFKIKEYKI